VKLLFILAWRNIWRNKRRSILTLAAITFATMAAVAMRGVQIGTYGVNIKNAVEMFTGYIQIQKEGYQKNPSLNKAFKLTGDIEEKLNSSDEVISYSPRVYASGLISYEQNSFGSAIFGISPSKESETTKIMSKLNSGSFFSSDTSDKIVIGTKLLKNLKAEIGDTVVVLGQGFDGSLGNLKFKIAGTIKTGSPELDQMAIFMGVETAQELLALYGNRVHAIAIKLDDIELIEETSQKLSATSLGDEISILSWEELMPDFRQSIELDNISGIMMLMILIIIVSFGILNTVLMSVTERFNEFGVTLSIGMPPLKLASVVLIETILIALIGIAIGNILGAGINYYIYQNPIEFGSEFAYIYEEYGFLPRLESSLNPLIFINNTLLILAISVLSCLYPMYKVYKLEALKGIRYT
jgi:putative ABC transport system permease protein